MSNFTRMAKSDAQEEAIRIIEKWCVKMGINLCGGTCIGKYYDTVILDVTYQGGEIYVHVNGFEDTDFGNPGVEVNGIHIKGDWCFEEFKEAIEKE